MPRFCFKRVFKATKAERPIPETHSTPPSTFQRPQTNIFRSIFKKWLPQNEVDIEANNTTNICRPHQENEIFHEQPQSTTTTTVFVEKTNLLINGRSISSLVCYDIQKYMYYSYLNLFIFLGYRPNRILLPPLVL